MIPTVTRKQFIPSMQKKKEIENLWKLNDSPKTTVDGKQFMQCVVV